MASKIKSIIQQTDYRGVLTTSWLERQGISRTEQGQYVRSGWLDRLASGVYHFTYAKPSLFDALSSMDSQAGLNYRIAASSALAVHGYTHYVPLGQPQAHIITPVGAKLPGWMREYDWDMALREHSPKVFDGSLGVTSVERNGMTLRVSSPELAIMECLLFAPEHYRLMDVFYLLESLTTLRSSLVSQLLAHCSSVKVKRLFVYMAEKANHAWLRRLDLSHVTLGSGVRSFEKGGVSIAKYKIVIPKELAEYE